MPYGFSKSGTMTAIGSEKYVARMVPLKDVDKIRVMAFESLHESILVERAVTHSARRVS
ncbi:hypothetical protein XpopCFBP1817_08585 [Xanthomonas populi]|uniref:Uncharacterized protein n=1 Tax=Xanthomonas populi TaxID=53414 RepID=A0A2S7EQT2_9XANT|nr:hypothetical protein XpopCFBP1817_08585 [Xanthomonas populi]